MMTFFTFLMLSTLPSLIFSYNACSQSRRQIIATSPKKLYFPPNVSCTGSLTFDAFGRGPYVGVFDGRIIKYEKRTNYFRDFSYNSPKRTKEFCDGKNGLDYPICGGPRGLAFDKGGNLYCTDNFVGLTIVGPSGGLAKTLVPTKNGDPFLLLITADVDRYGIVTFTDLSTVYNAKEVLNAIQNRDETGRLFKYDPKSKKVTQLLDRLAIPLGLASNSDASFLLVSEYGRNRILRYWLKGDKAGTHETFITFQGSPNEIKRNQEGNFWVIVNNVNKNSIVVQQAVKISPRGEILVTLDLGEDYNDEVSVVAEQGGKLYVSGVVYNYVVQYDIKYIY